MKYLPYIVTFLTSSTAFNIFSAAMETMPPPPKDSWWKNWMWGFGQKVAGNYQKAKNGDKGQ